MYKGRHPHNVRAVASIGKGSVSVTANNGETITLTAEQFRYGGRQDMPKLGEDIRPIKAIIKAFKSRDRRMQRYDS